MTLPAVERFQDPVEIPRAPGRLLFLPAERRIFQPRENLSTSQWAERYREVNSGERQGRWRNETTPYLAEPMDALDLPWVREVWLMFAPQTGKTQAALNFLCRRIDQDSGPAMYVMPDRWVAGRTSRNKIIPMLRSTPRIVSLLSDRADDTSTYAIRFANGMDLMLAWATSAAAMSSESIKYLVLDEIDKFEEFAGKEADPLSLAEIRTTAYPYTKKILGISTPGPEPSNISAALRDRCDEIRRYLAVCPICGSEQIMTFENIAWNNCKDPRKIVREKLARYHCSVCAMAWDDELRNQAVAKGRWTADEPVQRPRAVGFHFPSWCSPFISLSEAAAAYLRGQDDPRKAMIFVTQHRAEEWKETVAPKKESAILSRRTDLPPLIVPQEAVALTAGIDSHKWGFAFVVRAWAEDLTSWLIHYGVMASKQDVLSLLYEAEYRIQNEDCSMGIWRAAIDTGGSDPSEDEWTMTEEIYQFVRRYGRDTSGAETLFGTKGASRPQLQRIRISKIDKMPHSNREIPGGLTLRTIDVSQFKALIHWRLEREGDETQRYWLHAETGEDYAKQLLAEELKRDRRGKVYWDRVRKANHYLDAEVLAAACADASWLPSLQQLARYLKESSVKRWQSARQLERDRPASADRASKSAVARSQWMSR